jgi:hypothetical protein
MDNLVHGLANSDRGREVNDYVCGIQRAAHRVEIPDVPLSKLCFWIQIRWTSIGMDLGKQRIQDPDLVSVSQETIHDKRADEACATRDKNAITTHAGFRLSLDPCRRAKNARNPWHVSRSTVPLLDSDPSLLSHGTPQLPVIEKPL